MKSWLKNIAWLVFVVTVLILMSSVKQSKKNQYMSAPDIKFQMYEDQVFLTKEVIIRRLKNQQLLKDSMQYSDIDFAGIESFLTDMSEVKEAKVFTSAGPEWFIKITLKQAIARIFNLDGSSCYLDKDGHLMPLSTHHTAHVVTVNGYINETDLSRTVEDVINNDSLKTIEILDDLYQISNYVCSDEFFSSQITHIYINQNKEFELIPRVGNQRILFGGASI